jgi:hypothetical protein
MHERWSSIAFSALLGIGALKAAPVGAVTVNTAASRPAVTLSGNGWKFILDPRVGEDEIVQVSFSDRDWEAVESGADHPGRGLKVAFYEKTHGHRCGMPAACSQAVIRKNWIRRIACLSHGNAHRPCRRPVAGTKILAGLLPKSVMHCCARSCTLQRT